MIAIASQRLLAVATLGLLAGLPLTPRTAAAQAASAPEANPAPPPTIGERPSALTAEEVALRDQRVVLKGGAVTLDLGGSYSYTERGNSSVRLERRVADVTAAIRVGLMNDLQATLRLPARAESSRRFVQNPVDGTATVDVASERFARDPTLSLRGVMLREGVGRPNLIWSLDRVLPRGPSGRGVGAGLVMSKTYDPAVIFASLSYLHGLAVDLPNSLPKHTVGVAMGYTYAVNDALALSSIFAGSLRSTVFPEDGSLPPPRESYQLQLGLTWSIARGLFLEPGVAMRLGSETSDMAVSMNIAYTF